MPLPAPPTFALALLMAFLNPHIAAASQPQSVVPAYQIAALEDWLDLNSPWPRKQARPQIRLVSQGQANALTGRAGRLGVTPRAFYDPAKSVIALISPFDPHDPYDLLVVLHELVHHRQHGAAHWYCAGVQEKSAYELQSQWLAERGLPDRINWIAVILEAGCTPRDIHPD